MPISIQNLAASESDSNKSNRHIRAMNQVTEQMMSHGCKRVFDERGPQMAPQAQ